MAGLDVLPAIEREKNLVASKLGLLISGMARSYSSMPLRRYRCIQKNTLSFGYAHVHLGSDKVRDDGITLPEDLRPPVGACGAMFWT